VALTDITYDDEHDDGVHDEHDDGVHDEHDDVVNLLQRRSLKNTKVQRYLVVEIG
jgi:hypothetical protein